jgi:hypothetical protein
MQIAEPDVSSGFEGNGMLNDEAARREEIRELVRGLDPPDWVQVRLTAQLSPADRIVAGMRAQEFAMAMLRGTFAARFPELSQSELNMKVLGYLTPVRMGRNERA